MLGWRYLLGKVLRSSLYKKTTVFIGLNDEVRALIREIRAKPFLGYDVVFAYDERASASTLRRSVDQGFRGLWGRLCWEAMLTSS